jgi:hypothetical protein
MVIACSPNSSSSLTQKKIDDVLKVASSTLEQMDQKPAEVKESEVADLFAKNLQSNLNIVEPAIYPYTVGVLSQADGSFNGYQDTNKNGLQESGESQIFSLEVDTQGQRLLASNEGETYDRGFSGSGLLMGMFLGSMLSRQRTAGVSPSSLKSKTTTSRRASKAARSRSGSGSFSRGK